MKRINVLLCSAGRRPYLVKWFKEALTLNQLDGEVIVADADLTAPAKAFADGFLQAPPVEDPAYRTWLLETIGQREISVAFSINDFELSTWANLGEDDYELNRLIRLSRQTQALAEDKLAMSHLLTSAGLTNPPTVLASAAETLNGEAWVTKGRYGSGSRGLAFVSNEELSSAISRAVDEVTSPTGGKPRSLSEALDCLIIQPRIEGQEYGLDVVADLDGNFAGVLARKKIAMRNGETDKAVSVDPAPFVDLARKLVGVLGHRGSVDVDVIQDANGDLWLIDINPRFGGGYPLSHLAGAHLPAAVVAWCAGLAPQSDWLQCEPGIVAAKYVEATVVPLAEAELPDGG